MTVTTKTTGHWTGPSVALWGKRFTKKAAQDLAAYMTSYNMESQAVAIDGVNAENIQSTGTAPCMINGVFIPSLAADAELDISADTVGDAVGATVASGSSRYFLVLAKADGTLSVWLAGDAATDGSEVLKIPAFDPSTYCAVAILHVNSNTAFVLGTTALTGLDTYYQLTGPVFPHADNIDEN